MSSNPNGCEAAWAEAVTAKNRNGASNCTLMARKYTQVIGCARDEDERETVATQDGGPGPRRGAGPVRAAGTLGTKDAADVGAQSREGRVGDQPGGGEPAARPWSHPGA